jgi:hypothetical protein
LLIALIGGLAIYLWAAQVPWDGKLRSAIKKREAAGRLWRVEHYVAVYGWLAAAFNLALAVGLIATLRFWARPLDSTAMENPPARVMDRFPKWLLIGLGGALLLGASYRVQRLDHSLWSDEEYTVRSHIWGQMVEQEDGSLQHQPVSWRDTFFRNKGNNHLGFTIPTRMLHEAWASFGATPERPFSEAVMRLLPLLASFGSIVLIGLLVARHSSPVAGLGAALLLAISPWYVRYSVEARGYSQMIFFLLLSFLFLIRAMRYGRWRDWLCMAAAQLGTLLCGPVTIETLIVSNSSAFAMIFFYGDRARRDRVTLASRMVVANLLAAMVFVQLVGPSVEQVRAYLSSGPLVGHMSLDWWRGEWVIMTSGLSPTDPSPGLHLDSSFAAEASAHPAMRALFLIGLPGLVLLGILEAFRRRSWLLLPGLATIAGGVLQFVQNLLTETIMHAWYAIYIIIGFVIFLALGIEFVVFAARSLLLRKSGSNGASDGRTTAVAALLMFALVGTYGYFTANARQLQSEHSRQPIREVVAMVRGDLAYSSQDDNLITASFGPCKGMITSYDPRNRVLRKPADLRAAIEAARSEGKRLVVYTCGLKYARINEPSTVEIVENPDIFEQRSPQVLGLGEIFSYHIFEYTGSSAPANSE